MDIEEAVTQGLRDMFSGLMEAGDLDRFVGAVERLAQARVWEVLAYTEAQNSVVKANLTSVDNQCKLVESSLEDAAARERSRAVQERIAVALERIVEVHCGVD